MWPMRRSPLNTFMKRQGKEQAREAEQSVSGGGGCKREDVALHSCFYQPSAASYARLTLCVYVQK